MVLAKAIVHPAWMRKSLTAASAALLMALTSACGSSDPQDQGAATTAPTTAPVSPSATQASTAKDEAAYLAGLKLIDPGLVANEERALRRVRDICLDIKGGEFSDKQLASRAAERLSGGIATIDEAQGAKVVALAKAHVC